MGAPQIQIDPVTGERVGDSAAIQIDPVTGERIEAAAPKDKSFIQTMKDNFNAGTQHVPTTGPMSVLQNFGAGGGDVIRSIYHAFDSHPSQSLDQQYADADAKMKSFAADPVAGYASAAGQAGTGLLIGEAVGTGVRTAAPVVSDALETTGTKLVKRAQQNVQRTFGARNADFNNGHDVGRGYLNADLGTSSSMDSAANKAQAAVDAVGARLGAARDQATAAGMRIPVSTVQPQIDAVIAAERAKASGLFGSKNTAPIDEIQSDLNDAYAKANQNGGFTPNELFDIKQKATDGLNYDAADQKGANAVREGAAARISGMLTDAIPETKGLNQQYGDLKELAELTRMRANTGSKPLTGQAAALAAKGTGALLGSQFGKAGAVIGSEIGGAVGSVPARTFYATRVNNLGNSLIGAGGLLRSGLDVPGGVGVGVGGEQGVPNGVNAVGGGQAEQGVVNQVTPPNGVYGTTSVVPDIIDPNQMSRSRVGLGTNGSGGQIVRPLGLLNAPAPELTPLQQAQSEFRAIQPAQPEIIPPPLKGAAKWQQLGLSKLTDHIQRDSSQGINLEDVTKLQNSPQGKDLLMQASDLKPGSPQMNALIKQIQDGEKNRLFMTKPVPEEPNLQGLGFQAMQSLPEPIARIARAINPNIVIGGARQSNAGRGATASVVQGPGNNTIEINDPDSFKQYANQTIGHELTHVWQNNLPPSVQARIPDDPQNASAFDISDVDQLRKQGHTLATIPREKAATIVQTYIAQPSQRARLQPWVDDMSNIPMSSTMPTDPNSKGLNMTPRAPSGPIPNYSLNSIGRR